ncbi:MAG: nucleotidyltransferase domain-containing protein [Chloroflexota bacterium]
MESEILNLLNELRFGLAAIYARRLKGVYLYGSYARGEQGPDSDIDVLIVLDHIEQYGSEIERTSALVSELSLQYNCSISRVFVNQESWQQADTPLLRNARAEAVQA